MSGNSKEAAGKSSATQELVDLRPEAARKRLRECKSQGDACEAIREIVSNLLGCEEMALFEVRRERGRPSLIWSFEIEPKLLHLPEKFSGAAFPGEIAGEAIATVGNADEPSALVPIRFQGEMAGVLVLVRLLPQKTRLEEQDRGVLSVISEEAGKALFGHSASGPAKRERKR